LGFTILFALIILGRGLLLPQEAAAAGEESPFFEVHWLEFAGVCALVLVYANLLAPVGFEITTTAFLTILLGPRLRQEMSAGRAAAQAVGLAVLTTLLLYGCFVLFLGISLPLLFLPPFLNL